MCVAILASLAGVSPVRADDMDITLARLRLETGAAGLPVGCEAVAPNGLRRAFCPDQQAWQRLMSNLAGSLVSQAPLPAATTGYGGFALSLETAITGIDSASAAIQLGTEGDAQAGGETCSGENGLGCNRLADGLLLWTHLAVRKGFPFGFQLAILTGHLWGSSLWTLGAELHWALLEGLDRDTYAYLPDIALRTAVRTVVGDPEFTMTIPSVALVLSKPIGVAGSIILTPIGSFEVSYLFADSGVIDLTPDIDAYDECRPDPSAPTGECTRTDAIPGGRQPGEDFNNMVTFPALRAFRYRMALGLRGQLETFFLAASFSFDLLAPSATGGDIQGQVGRQWTTSVAGGVQL